MKIVIEGTYTTPNAIFLDDHIKIGREHYSYTDITDVRSVSAPARLVNGLVQFSLRSGQVLHVTYFLKDTEKMRRALKIVMPYVRKNKAEHASSAFLESDLFDKGDETGEGMHSIADELIKLSRLRDRGDLSDEEFELLKKRLIEEK
ncbi:MAG: SHOCT domain-containing protein [Eubacteriales bacterium]|nr:SHOCT domain-containing protein [Eubacteriales bacterium]